MIIRAVKHKFCLEIDVPQVLLQEQVVQSVSKVIIISKNVYQHCILLSYLLPFTSNHQKSD